MNRIDHFAAIYEKNPPEESTYRFVLQSHSRGKSVHLDFRYELDPGSVLLGWTVDLIKSISRAPKNLSDAKQQVGIKMDSFAKWCKNSLTKAVCQTKAREPYAWLNIDNATFQKGEVGATRNELGFMWIIDKGTIEYGTSKPGFYELFCHGTKKWKNQPIWDGRLVIRALPNVWRQQSIGEGESKTGRGYLVHMAFFADPEPYVISRRAVTKKWYPPSGISALPKAIRSQIPSELQYWKKSGSSAHEIRDGFVDKISKHEIKLEYPE